MGNTLLVQSSVFREDRFATVQSGLSIGEGQLDWKEVISALWRHDSSLSCLPFVNQFTVHELPS